MSVPEREIIVCYDVSDNKRRKALADTLLDIGLIPVQKSVFWGSCRLAEEQAIIREFQRILDRDSDRAFLCRVDLSQVAKRTGFGYAPSALEKPERYHVVL